MATFAADLRDIRFALFEHLSIGELCKLEHFKEQDLETYEMILTEAHRIATDLLAPLSEPAEKEGCRLEGGKVSVPAVFKEATKTFNEGGWIGITIEAEHGGMGMPSTLGTACGELFTGACGSFMFTPGLTTAAARVIINHAGEELRERFVPKMLTGEWAGTMCLTEPQAGSAVGDCRTKAAPQGDGSYLLEGEKIFITQGDHDLADNIVHLVLARTPDALPGTKGLSLFIVPKLWVDEAGNAGDANGVVCTSIEEKMGIHASSTCSLAFGDTPCRGFIIGQEGDGMRLMFQMMNEARIEVGLQGNALGNAAYQLALAYAKERIQGVHISQMRDPDAPRVAIIEHPPVRRMLMECKAYGEGVRALVLKTALYADLAEHSDDEKERVRSHSLLEILTPVCKAYGSDTGFRMADLAMMVHGGYGYISEYGVEQLMRDVKITSIYEGTNTIQALDLLGRKVARKGGQDFMRAIGQIDRFVGFNKEHEALGQLVGKLNKAKDALVQVTMTFGGMGAMGDLSYPAMHCAEYLEMFGDTLVAWSLLEQAVIAHEKAAAIRAESPDADPKDNPELAFYEGKVHTATFFVHQILPRVHGHAERAASQDKSCLEVVL